MLNFLAVKQKYIYRVADKKRPQFSALENTHEVSLGKIACFGNSIEHCLHFTWNTLMCWRLPYCMNVINFIRVMTSSSRKTVLYHTSQKRRNSFYNRTLQTS